MRRFLMRFLVPCAVLLLGGCAAGYLMDNQVQSFSGLPAASGPLSYTFERLPSQAALQPAQAQLEALADPALFKAGFRRDDAAPRYTVQVSARIQQVMYPWHNPRDAWGGPLGWGGPWGGPLQPRMDPTWFQREVGLVVRERATNRVVYETQAVNDGPWLDQATALSAMFEAALQGFPAPPPGPRRVDIQLGGRQPAATPATAPAPAPAAPVPAR